MSLRIRLEGIAETLQEFELALEDRFAVGQHLIVNGYPDAGIYLLGYVAEMLLKTIYFRFTGAGPADLVGPRLAPARTVGRMLLPQITDEHYHSLRFWAMLLQAERDRQGRPLPVNIALLFEVCTERLHNNWFVEMRYRRNQAMTAEALAVLSDVGWLRANRLDLWR